MFFYISMVILGFILLAVGADLLVRGASNIAKKFNIPEMIIGLTIVALGTSAPELIITINSAMNNSTDLIIGNAIGSNLCNLLLILGLMAILRPVVIDKDAKRIHIPLALASALVILFIGLTEFTSNSFYMDRLDGIILVSLFLIYFTYPIMIEIKKIINSTKDPVIPEKQLKKKSVTQLVISTFQGNKPISILLSAIFITLGVILLKYGGDFVVDYSTNIAHYFNISERVIGLTIVAFGTAMPELVTSIIATFRKDTDLAVGNLVGSCVLNLLLILGVGAILTPLKFSVNFTNNLILLCVSTLILWMFNFIGKKNTITRFKGLILLIIFSIYIVNLFA